MLAHLTRCLAAGIVALLPIGGSILAVAWAESTIAGSWLAQQPFYFPGLGLIATAVVLYVIGLVVTTFLGRFLWRRIDRVLEALPVLGQLYQTLKQILGYGRGDKGMFRDVVLLSSHDTGGRQIALTTGERADDGAGSKEIVFVPGSPNPTSGRLVLVDRSELVRLDMTVHDALKVLVMVGKAPFGRVREGGA